MQPGRKIRIAEHIEIDWLTPSFALAVCPNCASPAPAQQYLEIDYRPPDAAYRFVLQICPACSVRFVDNMVTMDYSSDELITIGWNDYQVQLGCGVWPISAPLTRIEKPPGARVLEIGGAYGFGLDFCIRARGWQGEGFDPSPLAAFGARELGLKITQDYFEEKNLVAGPWDVVIATEVIEHLEHPPEFFALMRRALAEDGMLVLTTPDAEWITPELSAGDLMPLLSPGAHLVLQTAQSLRHALQAAGFAQVVVKRESKSLVAYASAAPFTLNEDAAAGRAMYRRYLVERSQMTAETSDLRLGFAGRGLFESANDGDGVAAEAAWAALRPAVQARFGLDLATMTALPAGAADASLSELAKLMPLGLGMILFGRAMQLLGETPDRTLLLPMLRVAAAGVAALQNALAKRSLRDGLSASIGQIIDAEMLLCRAEMGDGDCVAALVERGDILAGWRGFVALVNAGALGAAGALRQALLPELPDTALPVRLRRNALLSLANFVLAQGGETTRAFTYAEALRGLGENADGILLDAFTRLVNASSYAEAKAAAMNYDINELARQPAGGKQARDALIALMVLDLAAGDPAEIPKRLGGLDIESDRRDVLLMEAFIRLVNASRYEEALGFIRDHDIPALAARQGGEVARNAGLARAVLELAIGDPALVPQHLAGIAVPEDRRTDLLLGAFTGLINAGRYTEAEQLAGAESCFARLDALQGKAAGDARLAGIMLDIHAGRTKKALEHIAALKDQEDEAVLGALLVDGFVRLVNEGDFTAAAALAHRENIERRQQGCAPVLRQDALAALLMLELQKMDDGALVVQRVGQASEGGLDEARLQTLSFVAFATLVNAGDFGNARQLLDRVEPVLVGRQPPDDAAARNALFAAGILFLQTREDWRRSVNCFARLRDALVKRTPQGGPPDALFWPAMRGEVVALHRLNRSDEASALLTNFLAAYPGAPDDLVQQLESVNP